MRYLVDVKRWLQELPLYGKFGRDVSWNIVSVGVLGVSGIIISALIARFYGPTHLGVFNQVFAVYIVASQFAVGGLQFSVLKHVSQYVEERDTCNQVISSAIVVTVLLAVTVSALILALRGFIGDVLGSPDVSVSLMYVIPGIACFAVNKVLMAVVNGYRNMQAYAFFQAMRYVSMAFLLVAAIVIQLPGTKLPLILSGAEILLLISLAIYILRLYSPVRPKKWLGWARTHISFGAKAFPAGALQESNTRVDVLMLGVFVSDRLVGIYSLAAMFGEGMAQLGVVLRTNVNPVIANMYFSGRKEELRELIRRGVKMFYVAMAVVLLLACVGYPVFVNIFIGGGDFMASWPLFCILMLGVALSAGYLPFNMLLTQTGHPGIYTLMITAIVLSNVMLNGLLIPFWGMYGAAIATGISFILGALYLRLLTKRYLEMKI